MKRICFTRLFNGQDYLECASVVTDPLDKNVMALDERGFFIASIKPEYVAMVINHQEETNGKESKD